MSEAPVFSRAAILGLGLIGSSLARAIRAKGLAEQIAAYDPNAENLATGTSQGFIDQACANAQEAVHNADLVLIAAPPSRFAAIAEVIGPHLAQGALVIDTGSVKQAAVDAIAPHIPGHAFFIPCHPIAGSEKTGADAGDALLFEKKRVILTPIKDTAPEAVQMASLVWEAVGAKPELLPPHVHDAVYAAVSHLPQLVAFASAPLLVSVTEKDELFTRFTRLAHSDPQLWADIFHANAQHLVPVLGTYNEAVYQIASELAQGALSETQGERKAPDTMLCATHLFPRVAASCLISAIMVAEQHAQQRFARYAGRGFADMAAPVIEAPEEDLKQISNNALQLSGMLEDFMLTLNGLHSVIQSGSRDQIAQELGRLQQARTRTN